MVVRAAAVVSAGLGRPGSGLLRTAATPARSCRPMFLNRDASPCSLPLSILRLQGQTSRLSSFRSLSPICSFSRISASPRAQGCQRAQRTRTLVPKLSRANSSFLAREFELKFGSKTFTLDFGTFMLNFGAISSLSGFMMSDILHLRALSIVGSLSGITYNMTRSPRQINAVLWGLVFMAVNCTMIVKLLLERREIHFTVDEAALYHKLFENFGVSPRLFKSLMEKATWSEVPAGAVIVENGKPLRQVILLANGRATAHNAKTGDCLYAYSGTDHGCIIGATAIVDPSKLGKDYPNTIVADCDVKVVKWDTEAMCEMIEHDHTIEAALMHTIYVDLIGALRRDRKEHGTGAGSYKNGLGLSIHDLGVMIESACQGGTVSGPERRIIREFMFDKKITLGQFRAVLSSFGWTVEEWEDGHQHAEKSGKELGSGSTHRHRINKHNSMAPYVVD